MTSLKQAKILCRSLPDLNAIRPGLASVIPSRIFRANHYSLPFGQKKSVVLGIPSCLSNMMSNKMDSPKQVTPHLDVFFRGAQNWWLSFWCPFNTTNKYPQTKTPISGFVQLKDLRTQPGTRTGCHTRTHQMGICVLRLGPQNGLWSFWVSLKNNQQDVQLQKKTHTKCAL